MGMGVLCLLVLLLLLLSVRNAAIASAFSDAAFLSSTLELNVGLTFSVRASFNDSGLPVSNTSIFSTAIPALDEAWFLPILSSPSFSTSISSQSPGFSLGFLFRDEPVPHLSSWRTFSNIYLVVCGGRSGNYSYLSDPSLRAMASLQGIADKPPSPFLYLPTIIDGYVVPIWIANPTRSLRSVNASLVVVEVPNNNGGTKHVKQLQLRDYNGEVFWSVSNVGLMEMQETGMHVIYDTPTKDNVVWKSFSDTLFLGQKLTVGNEIMSNDSTYLARMEKGGLAFYINTVQFMNEHPAPYWVIPIRIFDGIDNLLNVSKQVISSSPCGPNDLAYAVFGDVSVFSLEAGSCNKGSMQMQVNEMTYTSAGPLSFVKLENDGWLRTYAVPFKLIDTSATQLPFWQMYSARVANHNMSYDMNILQASLWDKCSVPGFCGPLGICSPFMPSPCTCPPHSMDQVSIFKAININDPYKGCTRLHPLPQCNKGGRDSHANDTLFIQLNHTASIFLFSGWDFNSVKKNAEDCKVLCSSDCSCSGFFYQVNNSVCFFIIDEMSLLNLTDQEWDGFPSSVYIKASNYVTYLKVMSSTTSPHKGSSPHRVSKRKATFIAIGSSFAGSMVLGLIVYVIHVRASKHKGSNHQSKLAEEVELRDVLPLLPSRFSFEELHQATEGFSKFLGAGACGSVHAGTLADGRKVAVKTLDPTMKGQSKQFLVEVATIGCTSHHNIVCLIGFCWEASSRMLVYEYMERGSLDHWLFQKSGPLLLWRTRYNVALGIARGLSYLHDDCVQPILHFDIKPQNILLDMAFVAKVADFGMSRLMQRDVSEVITGVRGTPGYIAPEWLSHGVVTKKCDVYSMGMVMLEIVGGRKNVDLDILNNEATDEHDACMGYEKWHFPSWAAKKCAQGMLLDLVDPRLEGAFDEEEAKKLIYTAFWCIQAEPGMRPNAATVVRWLEGSCAIKQPPFSLRNLSHQQSISSLT